MQKSGAQSFPLLPTFTQDEKRRATLPRSDDAMLSNRAVAKAAKIFVVAMFCVFTYVLAALVMPCLSDYTIMVITRGGVIAGKAAHYCEKGLTRDFLSGMLSMLRVRCSSCFPRPCVTLSRQVASWISS